MLLFCCILISGWNSAVVYPASPINYETIGPNCRAAYQRVHAEIYIVPLACNAVLFVYYDIAFSSSLTALIRDWFSGLLVSYA